MPKKIDSFDKDYRKRVAKSGEVLPANLARNRKFRSSGQWQNLSKQFLRDNPICEDPLKFHKNEGSGAYASETHHIKPLITHFHLRAYKKNFSGLCHRCHDAIEKMERGGKRTWHLFKR